MGAGSEKSPGEPDQSLARVRAFACAIARGDRDQISPQADGE